MRKIEELTKEASEGSANSQYDLATVFFMGKEVTRDLEKAVEWYRKAANQGHIDAQAILGSCYYRGWGTCEDYDEAKKWLSLAAEKGSVSAQYQLGELYTEKGIPFRAFINYKKAAERGYKKAQFMLAKCYFEGVGTAKNLDKAIELLTEASEDKKSDEDYMQYVNAVGEQRPDAECYYQDGSSSAQLALGKCYSNGCGVVQNHEKALELFAKAAENGEEEAQQLLAAKSKCDTGREGDKEAQQLLGDGKGSDTKTIKRLKKPAVFSLVFFIILIIHAVRPMLVFEIDHDGNISNIDLTGGILFWYDSFYFYILLSLVFVTAVFTMVAYSRRKKYIKQHGKNRHTSRIFGMFAVQYGILFGIFHAALYLLKQLLWLLKEMVVFVFKAIGISIDHGKEQYAANAQRGKVVREGAYYYWYDANGQRTQVQYSSSSRTVTLNGATHSYHGDVYESNDIAKEAGTTKDQWL